MAGHGRSKDHISGTLFTEDSTRSTSTVVGPVEVNVDHAVVLVQVFIQTAGLGGDASIGNHDIETTEVAHNGINGCLDLRKC